MTDTPRILVIGDDTRSFLATVRSLGRKGIEVHAAPYDFESAACASKYIKKLHRIPYFLNGGAEWLAAIKRIILSERITLIIPCEERALLPLFKHQAEFAEHCKLAIPDAAALDAFFDKGRTRELASSLDVPVAKGRPFLATDTAPSLLRELKLPLVAKWRKSYAWPDLYIRTSVHVLRTTAELEQWMDRNRSEAEGLFFEEMVPGFGLGLSVLCNEGKVLQAFEHHRAHEHLGSSYFRKSADIAPDRLAAVQRMVAAIRYTGLAMFEFKHDQTTGTWALLEVNARPWGSLPLPVALGIDFPYRLYQLLVENKATPARSYASGVYARNLISDMWQARAQSQNLPRPQMLAYLVRWLAGFWRLAVLREHHDAFSWDDPRPAWLEIKQLITSRREMRQAYQRYGPLVSAEQLTALLQARRQERSAPARVVFVCQGNICRSPYAELRARQILDDQRNDLDFHSAGLLPRNSRPSPPAARQAAKAMSVDLEAHRSAILSDDQALHSDLIVIFDEINLKALRSRYPELTTPVLFLGSLSMDDAQQRNIADPEGMPVEQFEQTYRRIDDCLLSLKSLMLRTAAPVELGASR